MDFLKKAHGHSHINPCSYWIARPEEELEQQVKWWEWHEGLTAVQRCCISCHAHESVCTGTTAGYENSTILPLFSRNERGKKKRLIIIYKLVCYSVQFRYNFNALLHKSSKYDNRANIKKRIKGKTEQLTEWRQIHILGQKTTVPSIITFV